MFEWAIQSFGISKIPSEHTIKSIMNKLQNNYSVRTLHYQGALGHVYYANDLAQLISQVRENFTQHFHLSENLEGVSESESSSSSTILPGRFWQSLRECKPGAALAERRGSRTPNAIISSI